MKYLIGLLAICSFVGCSVASDDGTDSTSARIIVGNGAEKTGVAKKPVKAAKDAIDGPNIPDYKAPASDDDSATE